MAQRRALFSGRSLRDHRHGPGGRSHHMARRIKYFQKGSVYVTYFDESVQGLQVDSIVKFRGVDIGTVRKIGVAPDQRLVEVS